ncbi:hypothetical protein [Kutzneria buriramensis]|uniref:DDE family transposase n=1 Tax=Kutzneria buriramensis TaxID=1045776 RepID=A0A3E0G5F4_9PSEU|nr:hypothetical protein [Kutzneria buriramensis]REH17991.1 hypothetical protein BCF44_13923 [Kutzneria buriramensis]
MHAPVVTATIRAAGLRWTIEEDAKTGKEQLGMDQYQVRTWVRWQRHTAMCMLAQAFLAFTRAGQGQEATCQPSKVVC